MSVKSKLASIADAIRNAIGITSVMTITQMISNVKSIEYVNVTSGLVDRTLTNYNIPSGVKTIGKYAFADCLSLASVTIPNSVTSIEIGAFNGCSSLTSVIIPSSVTTIGVNAFYDCSNLTDIYCGFAKGAVSGAPWGASNATIHYNS